MFLDFLISEYLDTTSYYYKYILESDRFVTIFINNGQINYMNKNFEKLKTRIPTYQCHNVLEMQPNEYNHHLEAGTYTQ